MLFLALAACILGHPYAGAVFIVMYWVLKD